MDIPICLRGGQPEDLPFVFSSTLQSYFYNSPMTKRLLPTVFYPEHKKVLTNLLKRPTSRLVLAVSDADRDLIYGFLLAEPELKTVHYMYVKRAFRRFGIMRELLKCAQMSLDDCSVSHWTEDLYSISVRKGWSGVNYNPYLLMGQQ